MLIPFHFYPVIYDWAIFFFAEGKSSLFIGYHQAFILFDTLQGAWPYGDSMRLYLILELRYSTVAVTAIFTYLQKLPKIKFSFSYRLVEKFDAVEHSIGNVFSPIASYSLLRESTMWSLSMIPISIPQETGRRVAGCMQKSSGISRSARSMRFSSVRIVPFALDILSWLISLAILAYITRKSSWHIL